MTGKELAQDKFCLCTAVILAGTEDRDVYSAGRYVHNPDNVKEKINSAGLRIISVSSETLRTEDGQAVSGMIVVAGK